MTKARDIARAGTALTNVDATELGYLDGVTSAVQTQLNQKPEFTAGKNRIINGDFNIWQRGTSFTNPAAAAYSADRFLMNYAGTFTGTISRQSFTAGTAPVSGYEGRYFLRINRTNSTTIAPTFYQRVEGVNTLAGQTATFSFWAKADTNRTISIGIFQSFGSGGGSAGVETAVGSVSVTTSWQRFSFTATVPSISGKTIGTGNDDWMIFFLYLPDSTTFTFDTWGWQIEAGSAATPFTPAGGGHLQAELALCQRYYQKLPSAILIHGYNSSAAVFWWQPKVDMRAIPTATLTATNPYWESVPYTTAGSLTNASLNATKLTATGGTLVIAGTYGTTPVQSYPSLFSGDYLNFSAEL